MDKVHIVLLYKGELPTVAEYIVVFKAGLYAQKELSLSSTELGAEPEAKHSVFVSGKAVFV